MAPRVRYYPFKVVYIDFADYTFSTNSNSPKLPFYTDIIRAKNAGEAKDILRGTSKRECVVLSAERGTKALGDKPHVRLGVLTKRQKEIVAEYAASRVSPIIVPSSFVVPSSGTYSFTVPCTTVATTGVTSSGSTNTIIVTNMGPQPEPFIMELKSDVPCTCNPESGDVFCEHHNSHPASEQEFLAQATDTLETTPDDEYCKPLLTTDQREDLLETVNGPDEQTEGSPFFWDDESAAAPGNYTPETDDSKKPSLASFGPLLGIAALLIVFLIVKGCK